MPARSASPRCRCRSRRWSARWARRFWNAGARGVTLTPFGEDVLGRLREVLRIVDEIEDSARAARDWLAGAVRLGVIPTVAPYILPRIVARLTARYPGLTCTCARR
jgi:LysR family hydrogen peroxide-inducible transcriptional activator